MSAIAPWKDPDLTVEERHELLLSTPFPKVFSGPACTVLADSISREGKRLVTVNGKIALTVWAEQLTHRDQSRGSASSRAVPVEKRVESVLTDPFVPDRMPIQQSGMQPAGYTEPGTELHERQVQRWLDSARAACRVALEFARDGIHKEISNRVLQPYLWNYGIISATSYENYFALRCHSAAQRQIRQFAETVRDAIAASTPTLLDDDQWHLPLTGFEGDESLGKSELIKVSVGRCARVSYLSHEGRRDVAADLDLFAKLFQPPAEDGEQSPPHAGPFEHVAHPASGRHGNFDGFKQARQYIEQGISIEDALAA